MASSPRVHDGKSWIGVSEESFGDPVKPIPDRDGSIFVSVVSYRDGERCGETLRSLFENAAEPGNVVVGLAEQNAPEDKFCIEAYCQTYGAKVYKRQKIREGVVKVIAQESAIEACPHHNQIRLVAYHHIQAKGPMLARSMARKVLGNEEYCMQVDAHSDFVKNWDTVAKSEWKNAGNEFGVLSNVPADKASKSSYAEGGEKFTEVPRQCAVRFMENGFPDYIKPGDGKFGDGKVADLTKPLLGHGWSAGFSFAKCHLEESAPYDNFAVFAMPIEQFSRFARMWTRGYDVYTPTRNIVFHDYGKQANGHGDNEWFKRQRDRFRKGSIERVKTMLQMPGGIPDVNDQANLGIYGLGKRRTLKQLMEFVNMDFQKQKGNMGQNLRCTGHSWVPYDSRISPTENLFANPDNLDPQPEYPLRTNLLYYQQVMEKIPLIDVESDSVASIGGDRRLPEHLHNDGFEQLGESSNMPSVSILFIFWIFGLVVWFIIFMSPVAGRKTYRAGSARTKRSANAHKDV